MASVTTCDSAFLLCHFFSFTVTPFSFIYYVLRSIAPTFPCAALISLYPWTSYGYSISFPFVYLYLHLRPRAPFPSRHVSDITLTLVVSCFCTRVPSRVSLSLFLC